MNVNDRYEQTRLRKQVDRSNMETFRGVFTRTRVIDATVDWASVPLLSANALADPADGVMYFIPGVSTVGDGDKVRP